MKYLITQNGQVADMAYTEDEAFNAAHQLGSAEIYMLVGSTGGNNERTDVTRFSFGSGNRLATVS